MNQPAPEAHTADRPPLRPAPVGTKAPETMTDAALTEELATLAKHQSAADVAGHPRAWHQVLYEIAPRRAALTAEQTERRHAQEGEAKARQAREQLQARQERTALGQRGADGRYPVLVDGRERGQVWRSGRSGAAWWRRIDGGPTSGPSGTRWQAADAVTVTVDQRTSDETERERRAQPPAGWVAADSGRELERLDVLRLPGGDHGPAWGRPWRVTGREEHPGGRLSYRLEPADADRPGEGLVPFAENLRRFVRPTARALAALPAPPFRLLHPEEYRERRLLNVMDELACLKYVTGAEATAQAALVLLERVEDGMSADPAADMREVAWLATELRRIVTDPDTRNWEHWCHHRGLADHAIHYAQRAAERFEAGDGALSKEYRSVLRG